MVVVEKCKENWAEMRGFLKRKKRLRGGGEWKERGWEWDRGKWGRGGDWEGRGRKTILLQL